MIIDLNATYYVTDPTGNRIYMFDEDWNYINFKSLNNPVYMLTVNYTLYITGINNIYKTDKYLNNLNQYNANDSPFYNGIYFNETNNLLYIVSNSKFAIDVFNLNLQIIDSILISSILYSRPYSIQGYNNSLFIGTQGNF